MAANTNSKFCSHIYEPAILHTRLIRRSGSSRASFSMLRRSVDRTMTLSRFLITIFALAWANFAPAQIVIGPTGGNGTNPAAAAFVPTLSALRNFAPLVNTAVIRQGYNTPGDAPPLTYTWYATCPATPDNLAAYVALFSPGAGCWSSAADPNVGDPREWGALCNVSTNDQVPMQAALVAVEALGIALKIPGKCVVSGLSITAPVSIKGYGNTSQVILASGSTAPAFSITIPYTASGVLPNVSNGQTNVFFSDFVITSPDRTDANHALEHGITATNSGSPSIVNVNLTNVTIFGIPGDGIHATAFSGDFTLVNSNILLPGQNGFYCNSSTDATLHGGQFYGALLSNWVLSGCTNTKIHSSNEYSAVQSGVVIFHSTDVVLDDDTIDTAGQNALDITNQAGQVVTVIGGLIRWSGTAANATYYDVMSNAGNLGVTNLIGVHFPTPASSISSNKPAGNVGFYNSASAGINCLLCVFDLGPIGTSGITNSATGQLIAGATQAFTLSSAVQFTGLQGFNGVNYPWKLFGTTGSNDGGALTLSSAGVVGSTLVAFGWSNLDKLSTPVLRSGFAGNTDITGRVTLSGGVFTYTFLNTYATAPNCTTADVTTPANASWAVESTTQVVFHGTGTDVVKYQCFGLN
jgi:hypothetical protein